MNYKILILFKQPCLHRNACQVNKVEGPPYIKTSTIAIIFNIIIPQPQSNFQNHNNCIAPQYIRETHTPQTIGHGIQDAHNVQ